MVLLKFQHNIRFWLTGITGTLFTETLKYQDGTTARWGGDVSQLSWKDNQSSNLKTYSLSYDTVGRLKTASFSDAGNASANFTEKVTQYDGNGNIKKLERYGRTGASTYGKIDDLVYTYSGNKATSIKDTGAAAYSSDFRFSNGTNNTYSYSYDAAGRTTSDGSKGISSITWNVLGLPQTVTFSSGAVINYSYAADGSKLREARTVSSTTTTTDYTGNLVLENGTRSRLLFDGGYVSVSNSAYHFFITDHLGSVRVVASASGTAEEYDHYYPLGGPIAKYSTATSIQPVKYQGKEWGASKGLNLYDFGARRYDPATGRWLSQDPLSEKYYAHSPYLFCGANPMRYVDPTGSIWEDPTVPEKLIEAINNKIISLQSMINKGEARLTNSSITEKRREIILERIEDARERIALLNNSKDDISLLGNDMEHVYSISKTSSGTAHHVLDLGNGSVSIESSSVALSLHEISHVRQSILAGGLLFSPSGELLNAGAQMGITNPRSKIAVMCGMEIDAYRIQYSFDKSFPGYTKNLGGITLFSVGNIIAPNGSPAYQFIYDYAQYARQMISRPSVHRNPLH